MLRGSFPTTLARLRREVARIICCIAAGLVALAPGSAPGQESLDDIDKAKSAGSSPGEFTSPSSGGSKAPIAEVNGYVDSRTQYSSINPDAAPIAVTDLPLLQEILEGNVQLKVHLGRSAFAYADVSLFYQGGWFFYGKDGKLGVNNHDVPALRPFFVPSELYVSYSPTPWLNLLAGKKRIIWGSGFAFNPTDLVNPPKDPTDPNFQRAGSWLARIEAPFEKFSVSALFSPGVLYQQDGIPYALLSYPDYQGVKRPDTEYHYLAAARLYLLLYDSDINFMYFFSNKYHDDFANKSRFGFSFSRYFFTDYELHVEALLQQGSARSFPSHACATAAGKHPEYCGSLGSDGSFQQTALLPTRLDSPTLYPRVLVGARTVFRDESTLSLEYYYQGDGYSDTEFADFINLAVLARAGGFNLAPNTTGAQSGALPSRFTFDPLRRHYLIASFIRPKIKDDWTIGATLIASLTDLSGLLTPTIAWNAREWLTLTLFGFIPIRGIPVGQAKADDGKSYGEYSLFPMDFRVLFEARAFY